MSIEYKFNLSVIIPHYNTPHLLEKLIKSIPKREDVQVIVVDDRSDDCLEKLEFVKQTYSNWVEFYRNDNRPKGAGACRNIGIEHAYGKWLLFADSDDFYLENMYESVSQYFDSNYEEVFFVPTSIYNDTGDIANAHIFYEKRVKDYINNPTKDNLMKLKVSLTTPVSKLIRNELIRKNNIRFDEVRFFNDMMFSVKVGHYSSKISISDKQIYCIVRVKGSVSMQVGWDAYLVRMNEYIKVCDFLKNIYSSKELKKMHYTCLGMLYRAIKNKYGIRKYLFIIKEFKHHNIPFCTLDQVSADSIWQIFKDLKSKRVDSKYKISDKK